MWGRRDSNGINSLMVMVFFGGKGKEIDDERWGDLERGKEQKGKR